MNFKSDSLLRKSFIKYLSLKERYEEIKALKTEAEKIRLKLTKQEDLPHIVEAWKKLSYYGYNWPSFEEIESTLFSISTGTISDTKKRNFLKECLGQVEKELKNLQFDMLTTSSEFGSAFIKAYEAFAGKCFKANGTFMTSVMKMPATEKFFIDFLLS